MPNAPKTTVAPARSCAYAVLRRVFEHGAYADLALHAEATTLDARDRALAMRLAYGAVQRRAPVDHLIARLAERPAARLDPSVLAALRLGLHELLYMSGSPDYAVVADAVELAKINGRGGHGLVNAVLRRALRDGSDTLLGSLSDETPAHAAIKHSHPEWLARLWWERLGPDEARALMAADNEPGEVALRANTLVTDAPTLASQLRAQGVETHPDARLNEALVLEGPLDVHESPLWGAGAFIAQSRAAMLVARALEPQAGERVLDLCAAPGGKTTHIAALMRGEGQVLAVERDRRRAGELSRTCQRLHARNVRIEVADAEHYAAGEAAFDGVLVDPPCSGLGTLQARADLRWRVTPKDVQEMARKQAAILAAGARALRPGGVLVYSTCTISSTENEHAIATFLDAHADFSLDDLASQQPGLAPVGQSRPGPTPDAAAAADTAVQASTIGARTVLTLPHRDRTAGFFIARVRRG